MTLEFNAFVVPLLIAIALLCFSVWTSRVKRTTAAFLAVLLAAVLCYSLGLIRPPRPFFATRYGYHPERLLPRWRIADPIDDDTGNWAIVDRTVNLLVIVVGDESTFCWGPRNDGAKTVFYLQHLGGEAQFVVPQTRDRILVYDRQGTLMRSLAAETGQCHDVYERLAKHDRDFLAVLNEL
jgi:hypothetical protein